MSNRLVSSRTLSSRTFLNVTRTVSVAAFLAFGGSAFALENLTLENFKIDNPDQKKSQTVVTRIEVTQTNITKDELAKLLSPATSKEERLAIATKMEAQKVSIPEVVVTGTPGHEGRVVFSNYVVTNIKGGKFDKMSLGGISGNFPVEENGGQAKITCGEITMTGGDLSKVLAALKSGDIGNGTTRFSTFSLTGLDVQFPEKAPGGPLMHQISIGSISGETKYDGDTPATSKGEAKNIVYMPASGSKAAMALSSFGYKKVDIGFTFDGAYSQATKAFTLTDYTISGVDAGALSLKGLFGNIDKAAFEGDKVVRMGALMRGDVDNVTLRFVNQGLFDKALTFYAQMNGKQPSAVKQEWAAMVTGILPMMLGGDPNALKLAEAVSTFIKDPRSLTISLSGKAGPVRFTDFQNMKDPATFVSKVNVSAVVNK